MNAIMSRSWQNVPIADDLEVTIRQRRKNTLGSFQAIGRLSTNLSLEPYDLLETLCALPSTAQQIYLRAKRERDLHTNVLYVHSPIPTSCTTYKVYRRAVAKIFKAGLMLQIKKQDVRDLGLDKVPEYNKRTIVYLINPHFLRCKQYTHAAHIWKTLSEKYVFK